MEEGMWAIVILVLWLVLSNLMGGGRTRSSSDNKHYPIERRKPETLTTTTSKSWSEITAENAKKEEKIRQNKPKQLPLRGRYPGLLEYHQQPMEVVNGEVVDDPQLPSGAPQLPSGHRPLLGGRSERSKRLLGG